MRGRGRRGSRVEAVALSAPAAGTKPHGIVSEESAVPATRFEDPGDTPACVPVAGHRKEAALGACGTS